MPAPQFPTAYFLPALHTLERVHRRVRQLSDPYALCKSLEVVAYPQQLNWIELAKERWVSPPNIQ